MIGGYDRGMDGIRRQLLDDGWALVRGVVGRDDIVAAKERLREILSHVDYYRQHIGIIRQVKDPLLREHPDPLLRFDWINEITFRDQILWERLAAHRRLVDLACAVLDEPTVFTLNGGGLFLKPPRGGAEVPWHQDVSPFVDPPEQGRTTNPLLFDFWLGLDPATEENGCLQLIPGSQHHGRVPHQDRGGILPELDIAAFGYTQRDVVSMPMDPGDVLVWHQDMFHHSNPNRSDRQRIGVASIYMGGSHEQQIRSWASRNLPVKGCDRTRYAVAINGKPRPLDLPLPPAGG